MDIEQDDTDITEEVTSDAWRRAREANARTTDELLVSRRARREEDRRDFENEHTMAEGDWVCKMDPCPWHKENAR